MSADPLEELLRAGDDSAPKLDLPPPTWPQLRRRRVRQVARQGAVAALLALLVGSLLVDPAVPGRLGPTQLATSLDRLGDSLAELDGALSSLRVDPAPIASAASEDVAMTTFRALHPGADRGDAESIDGLRWLARRFSTTHGGRCAQLFLDEHDAGGSASPDVESSATNPSGTNR